MRISDWSSDVCSSDLVDVGRRETDRPSTFVAMLHPALDFPPLAEKPCGADGLTGAQQVAYARRGYLRTVGCADRVHSRHVEALTPSEVGQHLRRAAARSEEHTSELQSLMRISYAVFCLKKKKKINKYHKNNNDTDIYSRSINS